MSFQKNIPLQKKETLLFEDLYELPFIIGGENCLYTLRLEKELPQTSNRPFCYSVSQISSIPAFVQKIPSVGVVLSSFSLPNDIVTIPVQMSDPYIPIGCLQRNNDEYMSSTRKLFLRLLKEEFSNISVDQQRKTHI